MKRCPACNTSYDDPKINFCLSDGTPLVAVDHMDNEATIVTGIGAPRTNISPTVFVSPIGGPTPQKKGSSTMKFVVLGLLGVGFLTIAAVGVAGVIFYMAAKSVAVNDQPTETTPKPKNTPTVKGNDPNGPGDQLKELEKELENAKKQGNTEEDIFETMQGLDSAAVATVNSPKDGFLALRSLPGSVQGERLAKIPHGETVVIYGCAGETEEAGKKGRWCRAIYNGSFGWVFDAWLKRI